MYSSFKFTDKLPVFILNFITSFLIFLVVVCIVFLSTVGNISFMLFTFDVNNYYDHIYDEYCEEIEYLAVPAGVSEGLFSSLISKDYMKNDISSIVKRAYNVKGYQDYKVDSDHVYQLFYDAMVKYSEDLGYVVDDEFAEGIANVSKVAKNQYADYTALPYIDTICGLAVSVVKYVLFALVLGVLIIAFMLVALLKSVRWKPIKKEALSITFITSSLMTMIVPLIVLLSGKIKYLSIEIKSLYYLLVGYFELVLYIMLALGILLLAIGVFFAIKSLRNQTKML